MNIRHAGLLILVIAGCRGPQQVAAPAPAGAVDCVVREAERMGYRRLEGELEAGVVRVGRYIPPPPAREPTDPAVRLSDIQGPRLDEPRFDTQLRILQRAGQLRIVILSESRNAPAQGGGAMGDARQLMTLCTR